MCVYVTYSIYIRFEPLRASSKHKQSETALTLSSFSHPREYKLGPPQVMSKWAEILK